MTYMLNYYFERKKDIVDRSVDNPVKVIKESEELTTKWVSEGLEKKSIGPKSNNKNKRK